MLDRLIHLEGRETAITPLLIVAGLFICQSLLEEANGTSHTAKALKILESRAACSDSRRLSPARGGEGPAGGHSAAKLLAMKDMTWKIGVRYKSAHAYGAY